MCYTTHFELVSATYYHDVNFFLLFSFKVFLSKNHAEYENPINFTASLALY